MPSPANAPEFRNDILDAARRQLRRFGDAKTNVVDIARDLNTSHTTIYRHFGSKADIFEAIVQAAMADERELAETFAHGRGKAAPRLKGLVLALHRRKRERFADDPEIFNLYRRMMAERPDIIAGYAAAMTAIVARILADGVRQGEFRIADIEAAAGVVRDAVTVFIHPQHVAEGARAGLPMEAMAEAVVAVLVAGFGAGV